VVQTPSLNVRVDGLRTSPGGVDVRLQAAGRKSVELYDARLVRASAPACSDGKTFVSIESGGRAVAEGPLGLAGSRELRLAYQDLSVFATLRAGAAVDFQIKENKKQSGCVRVPLVHTPGAPVWRAVRDTGFAVGSRLRWFPLALHDPGRLAPNAGPLLRLAVTQPSFGVWIDTGADFREGPGHGSSSDVVLASGAEARLFRAGAWALLLDAGYQVAWHLERASKAERATFRYFLHGPELAPKLAYALWTGPYLPELPGGGSVNLELELPVALWIRSTDAPSATLLTGLGVGVVGAF
jgi:hypothetical protein